MHGMTLTLPDILHTPGTSGILQFKSCFTSHNLAQCCRTLEIKLVLEIFINSDSSIVRFDLFVHGVSGHTCRLHY